MSRHDIPTKELNHTCVVGWDHGMKTYFARVEDTLIEMAASQAADRVAQACDEGRSPDPQDESLSVRDSTVFWIGADRVLEIPTVQELAERLTPYADISPAMVKTLWEDRHNEEKVPRTQHQLNMLNLILSQKHE